MTALLLRLGAPLQSWSGYRLQVNIGSVSPTEALPRKSAVSGLLGAALGPHDIGFGSARDLIDLSHRFDLHVRVDRRNPPAEDFQVLSPLPATATAVAERSQRISQAGSVRFPAKRGLGNFPTTVGRRDFLAHSEFILALVSDADSVAAWATALAQPVFMTYLGRRSCAPTFPFRLGTYGGEVSAAFSELPNATHVSRSPATRQVAFAGYHVDGDYDLHVATPHPEQVYTPPLTDRAGQLEWAKENLT